MADNGLVEVSLLQTPIQKWEAASAHHETIQREFDILRGSLPVEAVPNRLYAFIDGLDLRFADGDDPMWEGLVAASNRGDEFADVTLEVPASVGEIARSLRVIFAEVDEYCRDGESLLTPPTPPNLVLFREWFLGEFERQVGQSLPPQSWGEYESSRSDPLPAPLDHETAGGEGVVDFAGELDIATAGGLQTRIQDRRLAGAGDLTLDLSGLTFVDSVGLSVLVSAHNRVSEEGNRLRLILPERQRHLFELSGLTGLLDLEFVPEP